MTGLQLSSLLLLTDRQACSARGSDLVETLALAVGAGAQAVVLREKDLPQPERLALAQQLRAFVPQLIVASDVTLACQIDADGVHLAADDPWPDPELSDGDLWVGRSCHSSGELARATTDATSYATLSPIFPSESKPGYGPALGVGELGGHSLATYALGGITPGRAASCVAAGAHGVAVMGAVMRAAAPADVVTALLDELRAASRGSGVATGSDR